MKVIVVILAILVFTMVITPAYAVIVEFQSEKTSYKKGDKIVFSGRTDTAHSNKMVAVKVYGPNGDFVMIRETFSDINGNFQTIPIDTSVDKTAIKFSTKGIYNATAFYSQEPTYLGTSILFDYSPDGSPVSPSAAEVMAQKNKPIQPTQPTQSTTPTQPTQPSQPTQPVQPTQPTQPTQPETPKCGPGTTLKDGICVIVEYEPEPEPETESRYKETHIPGFPDPNKDPQYYINRYNTEPEYKAWFDRNFPDNTVYEIVGVEEPATANSCGPGTHLEGSTCVLDESKRSFDGGCLVATAAFGSELSPQVQQLRELRDGVISKTSSGVMFLTAFNSIYYSFSPTIADWERQNPAFKELVKITLTPMLSILSILNYSDIDSESQMIGYGLAVLLLNAAIYFVAPAFAIIKIRDTLANRSRFK